MFKATVLLSVIVAFHGSSCGGGVLPYRLALFDFGGIPGALGQPVTWNGPGDNRAFSSGAGSLLPPSADLIDVIPRVRWDDYFMMDPTGQSDGGDPQASGDGHTALGPGLTITGSGFGPGQIFGVCNTSISPDGQYGHSAGDDGRVYLANITLRAGSSAPFTEGAIIQILREANAPPGPDTSFVFPALRFGIDSATNQAFRDLGGAAVTTQRFYYLDYTATPVAAAELPSSFGAGVNYQIYLAQSDVPSPGPASLLSCGVILVSRRRRR